MQELTARWREATALLATIWRWWLAELGGMLPRSIRRPSRFPSAEIQIHAARTVITRTVGIQREQYVDERPLADLDEESWAQLDDIVQGARARLLLQHPDVLTIKARLPKQARRRLGSAVAVHLTAAAPLRPDLLTWNHGAPHSDSAMISVPIAMTRTSTLSRITEMFGAHGLSVPSIGVMFDDRYIQLAPGHDGSRNAAWRQNRQAALLALALIATVPFTTTIAAWIQASSNDAKSQILRDQAQPKLDAERTARQDEKVRQAVKPLLSGPTITASANMLSAALPDEAFLRSLSAGSKNRMQAEVDAPTADIVEAALTKAGLDAVVVDQTSAGADRTLVTIEFGA